METFAAARELVDDPRFAAERERALASLVLEEVDAPLRGLIRSFAALPCCFTLQCCYGHFVHAGQPAPDNLVPLLPGGTGAVRYRIAYVALCLENSAEGRRLYAALSELPRIEPTYIQFGSPTWFWGQYRNAFALQVEPLRFAHQDEAILEHEEALHVQRVRDRFFARLEEIVAACLQELGAG
jgi:hypothetical protein